MLVAACALLAAGATAGAQSTPARAEHGMVVAADRLAAEAGVEALRAGGSAVDAAVTTAFVLAVTYPNAGNIGGGGFLVHRAAGGEAARLRLPRNGARRCVARDVPDGRRLRLRAPPRQPRGGRRSGLGRRAAQGLDGSRPAAVAAAGRAGHRAGARRVRPVARPGRVAGGRTAAHGALSRHRWPPSRRTASPTPPATASASRISRRRWSGSRTRGRPGSTPGAPPS